MLKRFKGLLAAHEENARLREELASVRRRLRNTRKSGDAYPADRVVWIFGAGRTGSTWLASMLGEFDGWAVWDEPMVGALFGKFFYDYGAHRKGERSVLGLRHRPVWLANLRSVVLDGAAARHPGAERLIVKEPHGSVGAPLLSEALPESALILLVRDPRDVVSSAMDAKRRGNWANRIAEKKGYKEPRAKLIESDPDAFVEEHARYWLWSTEKAREAYDSHPGQKALVRYEDLRTDAYGEMRRLLAVLGAPSSGAELTRAVQRYSWENVPAEKKGAGKFYRKGTPGAWREDLTREQARIVEEVTASLLKEFYPEA